MLIYGTWSSAGTGAFTDGQRVIVYTTDHREVSQVVSEHAVESPFAGAETVDMHIKAGSSGAKILDIDGDPATQFAREYRRRESIKPNPTPIDYEILLADDEAAAEDDPSDDVSLWRTPITDEQTYQTPDGHEYFAPIIGQHSAVKVVQMLAASRKNVALAGPPGSGKTTLAQVAFGEQLIVQSYNGQTTTEDVVGRWVPVPRTPGAFTWVDGPLTRAMKQGRVYLANELNRADEAVQALLLPVTDHQRRLVLDGNEGQEVHAADGFAVIVDYNPGLGLDLLPALQSRMSITVNVPTAYEIARQLGVPSEIMKVVRNLNVENEAMIDAAGPDAGAWLPGIRDLIDARDNTAMFGLDFAVAALVNACPDVDARQRIAQAFNAISGLDVSASGLTLRAQPPRH